LPKSVMVPAGCTMGLAKRKATYQSESTTLISLECLLHIWFPCHMHVYDRRSVFGLFEGRICVLWREELGVGSKGSRSCFEL
jgi:hypothetical protein